MSEFLNKDSLDLMTMPGPRLPELEEWLIKEVWTRDRFQGCKSSPSQYLKSGEALVSDREILLSAAADSYFGELTGAFTDGCRFLLRIREGQCRCSGWVFSEGTAQTPRTGPHIGPAHYRVRLQPFGHTEHHGRFHRTKAQPWSPGHVALETCFAAGIQGEEHGIPFLSEAQ